MVTVAIHQPNYIPWLGYFRKALAADVFVFFDNVQMPISKSYVSRASIKTATGEQWLSVPIAHNTQDTLVRDALIAEGDWRRKHLAALKWSYGEGEWLDQVSAILTAADQPNIADMNTQIIKAVCELLDPGKVRFVRASEMRHGLTGAASILPILLELGATKYLTGSGAGTERHLDSDELSRHGIETAYVTPPDRYGQAHGDFISGMSIVDALLSVGPEITSSVVRS